MVSATIRHKLIVSWAYQSPWTNHLFHIPIFEGTCVLPRCSSLIAFFSSRKKSYRCDARLPLVSQMLTRQMGLYWTKTCFNCYRCELIEFCMQKCHRFCHVRNSGRRRTSLWVLCRSLALAISIDRATDFQSRPCHHNVYLEIETFWFVEVYVPVGFCQSTHRRRITCRQRWYNRIDRFVPMLNLSFYSLYSLSVYLYSIVTLFSLDCGTLWILFLFDIYSKKFPVCFQDG